MSIFFILHRIIFGNYMSNNNYNLQAFFKNLNVNRNGIFTFSGILKFFLESLELSELAI